MSSRTSRALSLTSKSKTSGGVATFRATTLRNDSLWSLANLSKINALLPGFAARTLWSIGLLNKSFSCRPSGKPGFRAKSCQTSSSGSSNNCSKSEHGVLGCAAVAPRVSGEGSLDSLESQASCGSGRFNSAYRTCSFSSLRYPSMI